ncbi:LCP family protein [Nonomuraea sp. NPDC050536]|uniref:LCP family protein n=1 Tax=Nonomuraea sp. NPDC050536 TaxID=3364366 RepID=UPI0037C81811
MDDLKLLRDFGRELEHQPPATLARQRNRLLSAPPRRRRMSWLLMALVAAVTAAAIAVPATLISLSGNKHSAILTQPPAEISGAMNVLLIGSDSREGPNGQYGRPNGRRADTMMIVHIPANRGKVTAVDLPRDSMVQISACRSDPPRMAMLNSAYGTGGTSCLIKTVEQLTGLRMDHFVELDFTGFKRMVDAVGGVEVTLPRPVNDSQAKLNLPAGKTILNGEQALGYVRLRRYGDGSDLQRIKRQQAFMKSMLTKVREDPTKIRPLLTEVRKAVKTDLDLETMYRLATQLQGSKVSFVVVPWEPAPTDRNRIVWKEPEAHRLFDQLK